MTTLCGHEREALIWALSAFADPPNRQAVMEQMAIDTRLDKGPRALAGLAITDPAKLAELMVEELRRRDIRVLGFRERSSFPFMSVGPTAWGVRVETIHIPHQCAQTERLFDMPQAHAALLRLMQFPESTPVQDVLKALGVGT